MLHAASNYTRTSLYFVAPRLVELRTETCPAPGPTEVIAQTQVSAISPGTEMLFFRGQIPDGTLVDATIEALNNAFTYPLKYGYACVARVVQTGSEIDSAWCGRSVFSFHPHESCFAAPLDECIPLPSGFTADQAALLPNVETAVNFMLDGRPAIGERILVTGLGVVGLLTICLLRRFPVREIIGVDPIPRRRSLAMQLGADQTLAPDELLSLPSLNADLAYEVSGNPLALDSMLAHTGFAGRIVVGSWYGQKRATLDLGGLFHRNRIRLISSQVSTIAPEWTGRWTKARRLESAWAMLGDIDVARLISHRFALADAQTAYTLIDRSPAETLQILFYYPQQ